MEKDNVNALDRNAVGKRAGLVGIIVNVLLATGKLIAGILTASISVIADAVNNFTDGLSSVVTLIGFRLAQKPADADHPYGHARFEYISSFVVSITVLLVGFELLKSSVEKIITPEPIEFSVVAVVILAVSILGKLGLSIYSKIIGDKIDSDALRASAIDSRNDVIITVAVLVCVILDRFVNFPIDAYEGVAVSIFILYSGIKLVKETISPILGGKNDEKIKNAIIEKIKEYPIVVGYHDLMIHDYGPGVWFCTIHFEIDKNEDVLYVHELIDKFEREFLKDGITLTVHYDPVVTDSEEINLIKSVLTSALNSYDKRLTFHDLRCISCDGHTKVFLDVPIFEDMVDDKTAISCAIQTALNSIEGVNYLALITYDSASFN